ncbi:hypothetical protein OESDEN_23432, partial [Oesophagostomum dentatum]
LERSLPSAVTRALEQSSAETTKASDLRKRVVEGDFSFFICSNTENEPSSLDMQSSPKISEMPNIPKMSNARAPVEEGSARMSEKSLPSCSTANTTFRIRERPQYASDAARRVLGEINKVEEVQKDGRNLIPS